GLKLLGHTPNINAVQTGVLATGKPLINGRRFPEMGNFIVTTNLGDSIYHGGTLEAEKRFSHGGSFHASYTFSRTIADVDSITNLGDVPEGLSLHDERGLSRQHVAHRFTFGFLGQVGLSVAVLHDFKFSSLVSLESGRPFNVFTGADSNGD